MGRLTKSDRCSPFGWAGLAVPDSPKSAAPRSRHLLDPSSRRNHLRRLQPHFVLSPRFLLQLGLQLEPLDPPSAVSGGASLVFHFATTISANDESCFRERASSSTRWRVFVHLLPRVQRILNLFAPVAPACPEPPEQLLFCRGRLRPRLAQIDILLQSGGSKLVIVLCGGGGIHSAGSGGLDRALRHAHLTRHLPRIWYTASR